MDAISLTYGKIGVGSPMALALPGARVGNEARVRTPRGPEAVEAMGIRYPKLRSDG